MKLILNANTPEELRAEAVALLQQLINTRKSVEFISDSRALRAKVDGEISGLETAKLMLDAARIEPKYYTATCKNCSKTIRPASVAELDRDFFYGEENENERGGIWIHEESELFSCCPNSGQQAEPAEEVAA